MAIAMTGCGDDETSPHNASATSGTGTTPAGNQQTAGSAVDSAHSEEANHDADDLGASNHKADGTESSMSGVADASNAGGNANTVARIPVPTVAMIETWGGKAVADEDGNIVVVMLSDRPINDDDLAGIGRLTDLRDLFISNTLITNDGLAHLKELSKLEVLNLSYNPRISDAGMTHVGALPALRDLNLFKTKIGDAGVAALAKLPVLEELKLQRTAVTDDVIPYLAKLKSLKQLWLQDTAVSPSGVDRLKSALPQARVRN